MGDLTKEEKEEKIYQAYKGTVERHKKEVQGTGDLRAFGIPKELWGRIIEDLELPKENFYKNENETVKKIAVMLDRKEMMREFLNKQPIFYDRNKNYWIWESEEFKYKRVDETDIINAIDKGAEINSVNSKEKAETLEALRQVGRERQPKEIKKTWIQFKETIVDVETGNKIIATPNFFITNPIPWSLNGTSETPTIDKIFIDWVGEEYKQTLYEIMAYCLLPDYPIHRIFCFIGEGLNGKSCFLKLLKKFVGKENCCSTELDILIKNRFETSKLHKKLVCEVGETNFNEISKTSILKKLSAGDSIGFEYKNKDGFDEENYAKIIIATNNLPTTTDKTIGFYRRWMIIDFSNKFSEKKDIIATIPEEEFEALGNKCVMILKGLLEKREFTNEGSVEERIKRYEARSNFLNDFIKEFVCLENPDDCIRKSDFKKKFDEWCKEKGYRIMAENSIGVEMKKLGISSGRRLFDWAFDGKGGRLRVWNGVFWKADLTTNPTRTAK